MFKLKLKSLDARLLIIAWFSTCMFLHFDHIWYDLEHILLGFIRVHVGVLHDLYFFGVWSVLFKIFLNFFSVFWVFNLFLDCDFVFRLFSGQTNFFGSVYSQTKKFQVNSVNFFLSYGQKSYIYNLSIYFFKNLKYYCIDFTTNL
jgi:hypothetical protein